MVLLWVTKCGRVDSYADGHPQVREFREAEKMIFKSEQFKLSHKEINVTMQAVCCLLFLSLHSFTLDNQLENLKHFL